jgi:hypothetical protein
MVKVVRRLLMPAVACAATLLVGASPAFALTQYSLWGSYGPVLGIDYQNRAGVSNDIWLTAMQSVYDVKSTNTTIPGGWSGGQSSLYLGGVLCASSSLYYFPYDTTEWENPGGGGNCGTGNYTARGSTAAYNGNGYNYYYTYTSPIIQEFAAAQFERNAAGQSYGSELNAPTPAQAPDLISAYATNGRIGYVLRSQLHPTLPANPAAALKAQETASEAKSIPVLAVDGKTVIGQFVISTPKLARSIMN